MRRPIFADPKTDLVFRKLFGTEPHKPLVIALLNDLLELDEPHRIVDVTFVPSDQKPVVPELKLSVVDVRCTDARGTQYVVEMQVLNVEGFERRVVYNASKAYVGQLRAGDAYPSLNDVVGLSICDFVLFEDEAGRRPLPMLSRWRMQEQHGGALALSQVEYVFLELPKYTAGAKPRTTVDRWAFFFREAERLSEVPTMLAGAVQAEALNEARVARLTPEEYDAYDRAKIAEQDARGALVLAERHGRDEGRREGMREGMDEARAAIVDLCEVLGLQLTEAQQTTVAALDVAGLRALRAALKSTRRWPDAE